MNKLILNVVRSGLLVLGWVLTCLGTLTAAGLMATPLHAAQIRNSITGSLGIAENACVLPVSLFVAKNCNFSGGASTFIEAGLPQIGPLSSGGFYTDIAAAPGFELSTQTGVDDNGVALNTFLVSEAITPGDGKINVPFTGLLTIDDGGDGFGDTNDAISGTLTLVGGARRVSTGNSLAGAKAIVEEWTGVVTYDSGDGGR